MTLPLCCAPTENAADRACNHQIFVLSGNDIQGHFGNESGPLFWPDLAYSVRVPRGLSGKCELSPGFLPAFSLIASLVSPGLSR